MAARSRIKFSFICHRWAVSAYSVKKWDLLAPACGQKMAKMVYSIEDRVKLVICAKADNGLQQTSLTFHERRPKKARPSIHCISYFTVKFQETGVARCQKNRITKSSNRRNPKDHLNHLNFIEPSYVALDRTQLSW